MIDSVIYMGPGSESQREWCQNMINDVINLINRELDHASRRCYEKNMPKFFIDTWLEVANEVRNILIKNYANLSASKLIENRKTRLGIETVFNATKKEVLRRLELIK